MIRLPLELVHRILEYDGRIKYRNGKYMNQIAQDDYRYKLLLTIPKIQSHNHHFWYMTISGPRSKIYCEKMNSSYWLHVKQPYLIDIQSNIARVKYIFVSQDSYCTFTIYKTRPTPFIVSVLQYLCWNCCKFISNY